MCALVHVCSAWVWVHMLVCIQACMSECTQQICVAVVCKCASAQARNVQPGTLDTGRWTLAGDCRQPRGQMHTQVQQHGVRALGLWCDNVVPPSYAATFTWCSHQLLAQTPAGKSSWGRGYHDSIGRNIHAGIYTPFGVHVSRGKHGMVTIMRGEEVNFFPEKMIKFMRSLSSR